MVKLNNNKSSGNDNIINEFIKNSPDCILEVIVNLFNVVLDTGLIPSDWCIGVIKPLFKNKRSPDDPDNYRGITLLSCLGKLFTSVLNARLSWFIESTGILGDEQAGRGGQGYHHDQQRATGDTRHERPCDRDARGQGQGRDRRRG